MTVKQIREDVQSLRGAKVLIFGQSTILNEEVAEDVIDVLDFLEQIEDAEVKLSFEIFNETLDRYEEIEFESEMKMVDYMEENDLWAKVIHDNTYNWSSPISNNIDFEIFKDLTSDEFYVLMKVHRFGDVRANYTEHALLKFEYQDSFIHELGSIRKTVSVGDFLIDISVLSDTFEVYDADGEHYKEITDIDDFREEVKSVGGD